MKNKGTVLIMDDSESIRWVLRDLLANEGFDAVEASNVDDGLKAYHTLKKNGSLPKLILTDLSMPGKSGLEFIQEIRQTDRKTPIIMVTTNAQKENIQEGKRVGANGWVVKPVYKENFSEVIRRFTE